MKYNIIKHLCNIWLFIFFFFWAEYLTFHCSMKLHFDPQIFIPFSTLLGRKTVKVKQYTIFLHIFLFFSQTNQRILFSLLFISKHTHDKEIKNKKFPLLFPSLFFSFLFPQLQPNTALVLHAPLLTSQLDRT